MTARLRTLADADIAPMAGALSAIDPWLRLGYGAPALAAYLARPDPGLMRMVVPDQGLIALRSPWLRGPCVEMLAVLPQAQGRGVGRCLLDWAWDQAGDNLWACVSDFNAPARAFYGRMGFVEIAPLPGLIAMGSAEILLRKTR